MADTTNDSATSDYTMGYDEEFLKTLSLRNAATHAAHLLPHLRPGMRVLDFGCGPGAISVGLAKAVEPGELHGVDMDESQVEMARAAAKSGGHDNATFHVADVTDLPFEDNSFDVAHCHTVLNHVPDTIAALSEVRRVLKPEGIVSAREWVAEPCFFEPNPGNLNATWAMLSAVFVANGGHPQMGRELKSRFREAGFTDIQATVQFESYSTSEGVVLASDLAVGWFFSPSTIDTATSHGLATQEQFDGWRRALDEWRGDPGAFLGTSWGEAIGRKA